MTTIAEIQKDIIHQLRKITEVPQLEASLLLAHVLKKDRSYILAFPEKTFDHKVHDVLVELIKQRCAGLPLAYLLGHKEFWSLDFIVNPHTLIPRPETEHLVQWVLDHFPKKLPLRIADLGTGCGAIACALAVECKSWRIDATDHCQIALATAQKNIKKMHLSNVYCFLGEWCAALPMHHYSAIVCNPPYIAPNDPHLELLRYEPRLALVAAEDGLAAIKHIIKESPDYLDHAGKLIIEHGYNQAESVKQLFCDAGFVSVSTHFDFAGHVRFTTGEKG